MVLIPVSGEIFGVNLRGGKTDAPFGFKAVSGKVNGISAVESGQLFFGKVKDMTSGK